MRGSRPRWSARRSATGPRWLAGAGALSFLLPSPEEAAAYPYTELERAFVRDRQGTQIIGAPETVRRGLAELLTATAADELMLTTAVFDPADRPPLLRAGRRPDRRRAAARNAHSLNTCLSTGLP